MEIVQFTIFSLLLTLVSCSGEQSSPSSETKYGPGFSYSRFSGPVSGPEHEILSKDEHGHHKLDYIAKPDYSFEYGVEDPKSKVSQSRKESRNGDAVVGEYSVVEPDGTLRTVRYTADKKNGFQAEILTNGKLQSAHGHSGGSGGDGRVVHVVPEPAPAHDIKPVHESQQVEDDGESGGASDEGDDDGSEEDGDDDDY